jgi:hypothetical protein
MMNNLVAWSKKYPNFAAPAAVSTSKAVFSERASRAAVQYQLSVPHFYFYSGNWKYIKNVTQIYVRRAPGHISCLVGLKN